MDGNNRWSIKKKLSKFDGYKYGANKLLKLADYIFKNYNIPIISAFALSSHNLKRSNKFIETFNSVLNYYLNDFDNFNVNYKIKFIGDLSFIRSSKMKEKFNKIQTKNSLSKNILLIFINYSGTKDIINAIPLIKNTKINKSNFSKYLMTKDFPDPDLLIRTGGYQRISDYMLFQISFTDLIFTKKLWPDLSNKDIDIFIEKYNKIEKKFGL